MKQVVAIIISLLANYYVSAQPGPRLHHLQSPTLTKDSIHHRIEHDLSFLQLQAHDTVADIGSYDGYYPAMYGMFADSVMFYINDLNYEPFMKLDSMLTMCSGLRGSPITCHYKISIGSAGNTNLPVPQFNKVILRDALHHFTDIPAMLLDVKLIMKDSAKLILHEPVVRTVEDYKRVCQGTLMRPDLMKLMSEYGFVLKREEVYIDMAWYEFAVSD